MESNIIDKICEKLGEWFDAPCNYAFEDKDFECDDWCEEHCDDKNDGACWKHFFEREFGMQLEMRSQQEIESKLKEIKQLELNAEYNDKRPFIPIYLRQIAMLEWVLGLQD